MSKVGLLLDRGDFYCDPFLKRKNAAKQKLSEQRLDVAGNTAPLVE